MNDYRRQTQTTPDTLAAQLKAANVVLDSLRVQLSPEAFNCFMRDLQQILGLIAAHPLHNELNALVGAIWSIKRQMQDLDAGNQANALLARIMEKR